MLKFYFPYLVRNLVKHKLYFLLTLAGFTLAISSCILIGLHVFNEFSYDRHYENYKNIYRVVGKRDINGDQREVATVTPLLGSFLTQDFPEIQEFVRFRPEGRSVFNHEEESLYWDSIYSVDSNVFEVFSHRIILGDPETALTRPRSIAVSERFSTAYFGDSNPIGTTIKRNGIDYTVALVFADLPSNTHLKYDVLLSRDPRNDAVLASSERGLALAAFMNTDYTYIVVPDDFAKNSFSSISENVFETRLKPIVESFNVSLDYYLEPLSSIHMNSVTEEDLPRSNRFFVLAMLASAFFILISACVNYITLASAQFNSRIRSIGIRKIAGESRSSLIAQSIIEPVVLTLGALGVSLVLSPLLVSIYPVSAFMNEYNIVSTLLDIRMIMLLVIGTIFVAILSGIYPALRISNIDPLDFINGPPKFGKALWSSSHFLLLLQYVVSISLMTMAYLMYTQLRYINDSPLGFDKQNKIVMTVRGADTIERLEPFISSLKDATSISRIALSQAVPGDDIDSNEFQIETNEGNFELKTAFVKLVDDAYLKVMEMDIKQGRNFNTAFGGDDRSVIVSEALVKTMGWQQPLGKTVSSRPVIGVVSDFNFRDFTQPIQPLIFQLDQPQFASLNQNSRQNLTRYVTIDVSDFDLNVVLSEINRQWDIFAPSQPFEYELLHQKLDSIYLSATRQMEIIGVFAFISIVISGFGIYALSAYSVKQRTREIGIRTVLGVSPIGIFSLFSTNFLKLIVAATVLGSLISYWAINRWLDSYYYYVDLDYFVFPLASIFVLITNSVIVGLHVNNVLSNSPAYSLRHD